MARSHSNLFHACSLLAAALLSFVVSCTDEQSDPVPNAGQGGSSGGAAGAAGESAAGGAGTRAGSGGASGAAPSGDVELYGAFNVTLVPAMEDTMSAAMTSIIGRVRDGVTPDPSVWKLEQEQDGCKLYVPVAALCTPSCGSAAVCGADNTCIPYPKSTTVGTVTLTGIGADPITMDPIADNYQPKAGSSVPYPPCSEGAMVGLKADGGSHAGFEIAATCIAPLVFAGPILYERGKPLRATWTAPAKLTENGIAVKLDLSHHGGSKGKIECEIADDGSFEVAPAMIDALVDLGVAGFPTISLTRKSVAAASGKASHVTLNITSPQEQPIEIPGLTSCSEDKDCPMGKTCQADRSCK